MSTITLDDSTRDALEKNGACRGLTLSDYLKMIAASDAPGRAAVRCAPGMSLADILAPVLADGRRRILEPRNAPAGPSRANFDEAMVEKYRKQGFKL